MIQKVLQVDRQGRGRDGYKSRLLIKGKCGRVWNRKMVTFGLMGTLGVFRPLLDVRGKKKRFVEVILFLLEVETNTQLFESLFPEPEGFFRTPFAEDHRGFSVGNIQVDGRSAR